MFRLEVMREWIWSGKLVFDAWMAFCLFCYGLVVRCRGVGSSLQFLD